MGQPIELERMRATQRLERSKAELVSSLRDLEGRVRDAFSPRRALNAHLGWLLAAAFAVGVGVAVGRREQS